MGLAALERLSATGLSGTGWKNGGGKGEWKIKPQVSAEGRKYGVEKV